MWKILAKRMWKGYYSFINKSVKNFDCSYFDMGNPDLYSETTYI